MREGIIADEEKKDMLARLQELTERIDDLSDEEIKEIWLDVVGYEGLYEVSNLGRVRSKDRTVVYSRARDRWSFSRLFKGKLLSLREPEGKYPYVNIYSESNGDGGKNHRKTVKIHRLVAMAFIPNPLNLKTVNHKDGNKNNNVVSNLEWTTHLENISHAIDYGLRDSGMIKVQLTSPCGASKVFRSVKKSAEYIGVHPMTVHGWLKGKYKSSDGFKVQRV